MIFLRNGYIHLLASISCYAFMILYGYVCDNRIAAQLRDFATNGCNGVTNGCKGAILRRLGATMCCIGDTLRRLGATLSYLGDVLRYLEAILRRFFSIE
jgi:hypothetical protein